MTQEIGNGKKSLLVFVVAYNAESTLLSTLRRIPESLYKKYRCRILIIDDSSGDETFTLGLDFKKQNPGLDMEVLFNPVNQGYGGNQKLGYKYAIDHGFDAVALLHGDGQYAPEMLEELAGPVLEGQCDAVFGSRMLKPRQALKGGMPLYKFIGNRILTTLQNKLLGAGLSEFHSGYRIYSVKALAGIPFQSNTNDFHFDTEIIIQFLMKKYVIKELPIPTYYGDEICYVNGFKYASDVVLTTIVSRMHGMGIRYRRVFDVQGPQDGYDLKLGYTSSHTVVLEAAPNGSRILDVGCGQGLLARELIKKGCHVHGVDRHELADPSNVNKFTRGDLNSENFTLPVEEEDFILLLDLIEHLSSPENFLERLRAAIPNKAKTSILITVPNVAFFIIRFQLLFGQFQYGKSGILDLTHRRLFTKSSLRILLRQNGYEIEELRGIPAPFPKALGDHLLSRTLLALNRFLIKLSLGLFSYQIYVRVKALPTVDDLLETTRKTSQERASRHFKKENEAVS